MFRSINSEIKTIDNKRSAADVNKDVNSKREISKFLPSLRLALNNFSDPYAIKSEANSIYARGIL